MALITLELLDYFATKFADKITAVFVKKESGKGLSSNDYTTSEKQKLSNIEAEANKYTHPSHTAKSSGLYKVTVDDEGHVSAASAVTKEDITKLGIPASDTNTWTALKGATASAAGTAGYAPAPSAGAANRYLRSDGTWTVPPDTNTTYGNMTGASASAAGKAGLVPAPSAGKQTSFLRGDGTWVEPTFSIEEASTSDIDDIIAGTFS